jgi:hypothetical protein
LASAPVTRNPITSVPMRISPSAGFTRRFVVCWIIVVSFFRLG